MFVIKRTVITQNRGLSILHYFKVKNRKTYIYINFSVTLTQTHITKVCVAHSDLVLAAQQPSEENACFFNA